MTISNSRMSYTQCVQALCALHTLLIIHNRAQSARFLSCILAVISESTGAIVVPCPMSALINNTNLPAPSVWSRSSDLKKIFEYCLRKCVDNFQGIDILPEHEQAVHDFKYYCNHLEDHLPLMVVRGTAVMTTANRARLYIQRIRNLYIPHPPRRYSVSHVKGYSSALIPSPEESTIVQIQRQHRALIEQYEYHSLLVGNSRPVIVIHGAP